MVRKAKIARHRARPISKVAKPRKLRKDEAQKERQAAVATHHVDLSTDEIGVRIEHTNTLISMYDAQRLRNQRVMSEASIDLRTCGKMIEELQRDVATLNALVRVRHAALLSK